MTTLLAYIEQEQTFALRDAAHQVITQLGGSQREQIYLYICEHPEGVSMEEINHALFRGKKINAVCGRINELRSSEKVMLAGSRKNEITGMMNAIWIKKQ